MATRRLPSRNASRFCCTAALLVTLGAPEAARSQTLELVAVQHLPDGGEVVSYEAASRTLAVTGSTGVRLFKIDTTGQLSEHVEVDLSGAFGDADQLRSVSSTALDPAGRGFGVVSVIPIDNGARRGVVLFFDTTDGTVRHRFEAGYHPDAVVFQPDGRRLFVVNEGEFTVGGPGDAPGSLTMVDLSAVTGPGDLQRARFDGEFTFTPWATGGRVDLAAMRLTDDSSPPYRQAEPEYAAVASDRVYVTFQENNALGVFRPSRRQWEAVWPLGTVPITIDASDKDGETRIDRLVDALPMPDTLAVFEYAGRVVVATADEGDFRMDGADRRRLSEFKGVEVGAGLSPHDLKDPSVVGRLRVSVPESDPDRDGLLDRVVVPGTRGVSFWDGQTGERLGGTGSLEGWLLEQDPARHNLNAKDVSPASDQRSDDKGPEPEGLVALTLPDARVLVVVAMERQNGLVLIDASDPADPQPLAYRNDLTEGLAAPESVIAIPCPEDPAEATHVIVVGYEGNDDGDHCGVAVYRLKIPAKDHGH